MDQGAEKNRGWLNCISAISKETGETVASLADAIVDNRITLNERQTCIKETYEALQALAALWVALSKLNAK